MKTEMYKEMSTFANLHGPVDRGILIFGKLDHPGSKAIGKKSSKLHFQVSDVFLYSAVSENRGRRKHTDGTVFKVPSKWL